MTQPSVTPNTTGLSDNDVKRIAKELRDLLRDDAFTYMRGYMDNVTQSLAKQIATTPNQQKPTKPHVVVKLVPEQENRNEQTVTVVLGDNVDNTQFLAVGNDQMVKVVPYEREHREMIFDYISVHMPDKIPGQSFTANIYYVGASHG
jgi:hypothetical protein